jgi:uncharacterized membrane protein
MKKSVKIATAVGVIISLLGIVLWQLFLSDSVNYYITSVCILIISMLPFFISFEVEKISSREVTLVATLIALAVVSRAAFYLIPQVKPIAAVVIASAVCLGAQRAYIIGAFSAFISNFIFGQGYWTPFQMVALGLVGLFAGLIFNNLKANRWSLAIVGFVLTFALYGFIVDASSVFMMSGDNLTIKGALAIYASGTPFSALFGASTAIFLFFFGKPFIKKIQRINIKFNLVLN